MSRWIKLDLIESITDDGDWIISALNSYPRAERTDYFLYCESWHQTTVNHSMKLISMRLTGMKSTPHNMDALNTILSDYIIDKDYQKHKEQVQC